MSVEIKELGQAVDQVIDVRGWLHGKRESGKLAFLLVRDGTGICQCVVSAETSAAFAQVGDLTQESSLTVSGRVRRDERAPGGFELVVTGIQLIHRAEPYPISRKAHGTDFLMNHRHLWLRSPRQAAILRVRHTLIQAARAFFDQRGFTLIDTPLLVPGAAEGAGTLFSVDYFDQEVFLAQTGQLYLESAAMALGKVYCFGPTFRAEKSKTRRHLAEFWMIEPEIAFAELADLVTLAEAFIVALVQAALTHNRVDLQVLERDVGALERVQAPFPVLTYSEAVERLRSDDLHLQLMQELAADQARLDAWRSEEQQLTDRMAGGGKKWQLEKWEREAQQLHDRIRELAVDVQNRPLHIESARTFDWGQDLGGDEETILSRQFDRPVIITRYPRDVKAFYMKPDPADGRVVLNMDVIAPEGYGEIIGGSQREDDAEALLTRMQAEGMNPDPYQWYLDLRRYGSVPHGGFGLGLERTVAWICGLKHIRETIPFPRMMGRMAP